MATENYNPMDSIVHGLPAVIVGAVAMAASALFGAHGVTLDTTTISGGLMAVFGIVQGIFHAFQNQPKK